MNMFTMVALLSLVTGCTTTYEQKFYSGDGWRVGKVVETETNRITFKIADIDCRKQLPDAAPNISQLAYIQFEFNAIFGKYFYSGPKRRHAVVFVPADRTFRNGDLVYVNIRDCGMPLVHIK